MAAFIILVEMRVYEEEGLLRDERLDDEPGFGLVLGETGKLH
jgi:hypothetical protein